MQLNLPSPSSTVYKDDCVYCFDSPFSADGLDVCLQCFVAVSPAPERNFTKVHNNVSGHNYFVNIKKVLKPKDEWPDLTSDKIEVKAESEADYYSTDTAIKSLDGSAIPENSQQVVDAILSAQSYSQREEIQAWEMELTSCRHIDELKQEDKKSTTQLKKCNDCELTQNLWLCLQCGNVGCGRAQFGGIEGHSHGLAHFENTGHSVSAKLGSISAEGTVDIFCYSCQEERVDKQVQAHLSHWGINIASSEKTEKSLTELQLEENMKWDFSSTKDGADLLPLFGPGYTGMKNLGNTCYMASVLQCLFTFRAWQDRYPLDANVGLFTDTPAKDLEVQLRKIGDGLLSGRYSVPDPTDRSSNPHQRGIAPGMFKSAIAQNHEEFGTMRQQDSFEFLMYLCDQISRNCKKTSMKDVVDTLRFQSQTKFVCPHCKKVKYTKELQENLSVAVPARVAGTNDEGNATYETVPFIELIEILTRPEQVEFKCKCTNGRVEASKTVSFETFPDILVVNARRFDIVNWVPTKLAIPVDVPDEIDLSAFIAKPIPESEEIMDDSDEEEDDDNEFEPNQEARVALESMGFPAIRIEKALRETGNSDAEAAANWLFAHMDDADIDSPIQTKKRKTENAEVNPEHVEQLQAMGFSSDQSRASLRINKGNLEAAVGWLFDNPNVTEADVIAELSAGDSVVNSKTYGTKSLPATYRLVGAVCHKGNSVHSGHYVAVVRKADQWVLFNDEKVVSGVDAKELIQQAYIYFFEKV